MINSFYFVAIFIEENSKHHHLQKELKLIQDLTRVEISNLEMTESPSIIPGLCRNMRHVCVNCRQIYSHLTKTLKR